MEGKGTHHAKGGTTQEHKEETESPKANLGTKDITNLAELREAMRAGLKQLGIEKDMKRGNSTQTPTKDRNTEGEPKE